MFPRGETVAIKPLLSTKEEIEAELAKVDLNQASINSIQTDLKFQAKFFAEQRRQRTLIEEMPLGQNDHHDRAVSYYSSDQILEDLEQHFELVPSTMTTAGPTRYYRLIGHDNSRVGFISPHSHNFCESCNRVRVTAEGRLLLCLGQEHSMDLRHVMRANPGDSDALRQALIDSMEIKPKGHDFNLNSQEVLLRHMNLTGG